MLRKAVVLTCACLLAVALCQSANAQIVLRFGHQNAPDHSIQIAALRFAELVDKKTNGAVKIQVFPSAQLGGLNDLWTGVKIGSIDIAGSLPATVAQDLVPETTLFDAPYMFHSVKHFENVWRGAIGQQVSADLAKNAGVHLLYMQYFGTRELTSNKLIHKPDDLKGLKIRSVTLPVFLLTIEGMGGTPTPLDFSEVYQSLRSGVVDGQENPPSTIYTAHLNEVQKYMMMTGHILGVVTTMMNEKKFASLKPEYQKALVEAGAEAGLYGDKVTADQEVDLINKLKEKGMTVVDEKSGLDVEAFRKRVRDFVYPKLAGKWPKDVLERVEAENK